VYYETNGGTMQVVKVDSSGAPTNEVLASRTIPELYDPAMGFNFDGAGASVVAGQRYALVAQSGGFLTWSGSYYQDRCRDGQLWGESSPGVWSSSFWGSSSRDALFSTYISPPETNIDSTPNSVTNTNYASFDFSSDWAPGGTSPSFECSLDGDYFGACESPRLFSNLSEGPHIFKVRSKAGSNIDPTPAEYRWTVDTTAPVAKAPAHSFPTTSSLGTSTTGNSVPVKLTWPATDNTGGSGIASYQLQQSLNGGAYTDVTLPTATTTTITPSLTPSATYRFRVAAKDKAGNGSFWAYGPSFKVTAYQESSSSIVDTGTWSTATVSGYYGGSLQHASASGRKATFTVPAGTKNVKWVSGKASNRGKAQVWLDGIQQDANPSLTGTQPFDLYSSSSQARQAVFSKAVDPAKTHTLQVIVLGQKNGSSTGTRVDIDAFITTS
jgi:hypothetical protein